MTINLKQVIDAVESANEVYTALYDTQTGKTVYLPDEIITDEWDEDLEELIENSPAGRFLSFPTKYEIHEYSIMESFIESLPPGATRQELTQTICGKGAFRRFKNGIYYHRLDQQWYDYQNQSYSMISIRIKYLPDIYTENSFAKPKKRQQNAPVKNIQKYYEEAKTKKNMMGIITRQQMQVVSW